MMHCLTVIIPYATQEKVTDLSFPNNHQHTAVYGTIHLKTFVLFLRMTVILIPDMIW